MLSEIKVYMYCNHHIYGPVGGGRGGLFREVRMVGLLLGSNFHLRVGKMIESYCLFFPAHYTFGAERREHAQCHSNTHAILRLQPESQEYVPVSGEGMWVTCMCQCQVRGHMHVHVSGNYTSIK